MFNFKILFYACVLSTVFTGFIVAQPSPHSLSKKASSSNDTQSKQNFVSLDGGFIIALPQQVSGFEGIKPTAGVNKGGSNFSW